jgi:hypothetical protein
LEIGSKGELIPRSKLRWEPFNLHSQYYMVFGKSVIIKILFQPRSSPPGTDLFFFLLLAPDDPFFLSLPDGSRV